MNSATKLTAIRTRIAKLPTAAAKRAEIGRLLAACLSKAIGQSCIFATVGEKTLVTEWKTQIAASKAAAFMRQHLGYAKATIDFDADLGWVATGENV